MDQTANLKGNLVAWQNRYKQPGDDKPVFDGHVTKPGSEEELPLALWAHEYTDKKTGERKIMFTGTIGRMPRNVAAIDQVAALIAETSETDLSLSNVSVSSGQIVLFPNGFKDQAPEKDRPDYWGPMNFGDGTPVVRASVWLKQKDGRPYVSGATSFPIPGKTEPERQDDTLTDLLSDQRVTKGMPAERKSRKGGEGRA